MVKKEVGIIDYLYVIVKWRKFIIINFFAVCIVAVGISLILPKWYRARTTILSPTEENTLANFSSLIGDFPLRALGFGGVSEKADVFIAVLKSRTVMETVAEEFDLMKIYKEKNMEETVKKLRKHVAVNIDDEGTITLWAEASTPYLASKDEVDKAKELAKDMANFFIEELDRINKRLRTERARNTRIFIERRYHENWEDLLQAEEKMKEFQEKYGIIVLPEQTSATISAALELKAQIISKEVESNVLQKSIGKYHTDFIRVQNELKELRDKYEEFRYGPKSELTSKGIRQKDLFLPFEEAPDLGVQYVRLFREVTLQEKILEFLLPQYEQAKIQEAKDTPSLQILDRAVKPERKHRPKRAIIVIFYGFVSILFSTMYIFLKPTALSFYQDIKEKNK